MTTPTLREQILVPLDALVPYARNARTHSPAQVAQLAASIREFGWTNPVLIDETGGIIAGHGRVLGARELGMDAVPCLRLTGLTDAQKRAYVLADNQLALNAGWDEALLAEELSALGAMEFDLGVLGFDADTISELLAGLEPAAVGNSEPDAVPDAPAIPTTQPGDVWLMGRHRVMCGDSRLADSVQALMAGGHADLLVTDPPYNVAYVGKTEDALTIENDAMPDADFRRLIVDCLAAANAVMRPGASFYIWHADTEGFNVRAAAMDVGWKVRQCLIWAKNTLVMGRQDYHWKHEPCLYGWKDGAAHGWYSDRKQSTLLEFDRPTRSADHPTMKPVSLIRYQIDNSSRPGHTVLDLFGGSGTTLIACEMTHRSARLMELDPKYVDVIVRRWQAYTGQRAVHAETGAPFPA